MIKLRGTVLAVLLPVIGVIGAAVVAPQMARANLLVEYSINGGVTFFTICSAASGTPCSGSVANVGNGIGLTIESASSNSPGTAVDANLLSAVTRMQNN